MFDTLFSSIILLYYYNTESLDKYYALQIEPPFLPKVQDDTDFSNFDANFTSLKPVVTPPDSKYLMRVNLPWIHTNNNFIKASM